MIRKIISCTFVCSLLVLGTVPVSADVSIEGNWSFDGESYISPDIQDLDSFRDYFAGVFRLYDQYEPHADRWAAGIEAVGPISLRSQQGEFGSLGVDVGFNPLATGGTQDIATGGDYIDKQVGSPNHTFEVAHVDVERNVFRQDFGPVQTNQRTLFQGGNLEWYTFNFLPTSANPFPSSNVFNDNPTASLSSIPEPASTGVLMIGLMSFWLRRKK